jgi:dihydrofolate reductase
MISAILACDDRGGIGKNSTLPWPKNNEDLAYFKRMTDGKTVIMGSSTWQSKGMPKPLPNRYNVVVTLHPKDHPGADEYLPKKGEGLVDGIRSLEDWRGLENVFIIGGAKLINEVFLIIDRFYLSRIPGDYDCDTFLPMEKIESHFHRTVVAQGHEATYETWYRK